MKHVNSQGGFETETQALNNIMQKDSKNTASSRVLLLKHRPV